MGRILYHDPNPDGRELVPLEDLSISVDMTVNKKARTIITDGSINSIKGTNGTMSFLDGTAHGDKKSLTTSYTDIGTTFNKPSDDAMEGFGMTDIQIQFDTSYAPVVKIKFVDIRGGMLTRQSFTPDDNKYNIFFDLPYPMFSLTVKGYYGKAISYCLHMTKWNGMFNSETGNFEIEAEFIGYTYAILTDMLMGYLKAIPKTDVGAPIFKKIQEEYANSGIPILTIDEMLLKISKLNDNITKFKNDDPDYQKLIAKSNSTEVLRKIKQRMIDFLNEINTLQPKFAGDNIYIIVTEGSTSTYTSNPNVTFNSQVSTNDYSDIINNYETEIEGLISELNSVDPDANIDFELFKVIETKNVLDVDIVEDANPSPAAVFRKNDNYLESEENRCLTLAAKIRSAAGLTTSLVLNSIPSNTTYQVFDLFRGSNEFNRVISENCDKQTEIKSVLSRKLKRDAHKDLEFNPTIKNLVRTITTHCEVLLESIQTVAKHAELEEPERTKLLQKLNPNRLDAPISDTNVYAFPEYNENGTEKWIGTIIDEANMGEVKFVKNLLDKLIESKQDDIEIEILAKASTVDWWALTPIDIGRISSTSNEIIGNPGLSINPYKTIPANVKVDDVLRILMYRMFLYLGVANIEIEDNMLAMMGKFEANNLFYGMTEGTIRDGLADNYNSGDKYKKHFLEGSDQIPNYLGKLSKIPYMYKNGNDYLYTYLKGAIGTNKVYIPVNGGWSGEEFYNGRTIKTDTELVTLGNSTNIGESISFISNYINGNNDTEKVSDGGRYIDIISSNAYNNTKYTKPTTLSGLITKDFRETIAEEEVRPTQNAIENVLTDNTPMKGINPIAGKFGSTEFFHMDADGSVGGTRDAKGLKKEGDNTLIAPTFYDFSKDGSVLARKTDNGEYSDRGNNMVLSNEGMLDRGGNLCVPKIEFGFSKTSSKDTVYMQSLFGSPLYYAQLASVQEMLAKGYLFVNTFPLRGIKGTVLHSDVNTLFGNDVEDIKTISGLFSNNAGFVKVPTLWCYWVGSILWRYKYMNENNIDPIVTTGIIDNTVVTLVEGFTVRPTHDELFFSLGLTNDTSKPPMYVSGEFVTGQDTQYKKLDITLRRLPQQAKDTFITLFTNWVSKDFTRIDEQYRMDIASTIVTTTITPITNPPTTLANFTNWRNDYVTKFANGYDVNNGRLFPNSISIQEARVYTKIGMVEGIGYYYDLTNNLTTQINTEVTQLMLETSVIANYSPHTFRKTNLTGTTRVIKVSETKMNIFLNSVATEYAKLYKDFKTKTTDEDYAKNGVFNSTNHEEILLNIYRYVSALNNKWVGSYESDGGLFFPCAIGGAGTDADKAIASGETRTNIRLIDTFRFVDKAFNNIGDDFIVNPKVIASMITSNYNQSFFDYINRILANNNFNFIPLPSFVNFKNEQAMDEIFKPIPYNQAVEQSNVGPTFVCVYAGQMSTHLDLGSLSGYKSDALDLHPDAIRKDRTFDIAPDLTKGDMYAPVFEVNYGQQNQSYFQNIKLDQSEFTETEESLTIIDDLSKSSDKNKGAYIGQNLFNIYQTRSYSAEVEALGMPLIQPMMYFQLNNIPMFRGAYLIIKTEHHITANHMKTKFKGVRIKDVTTPLYKSAFEIMDFVGDIDDCGKNLIFRGDNIIFDDTVKSGSEGADIYVPSPLTDIDAATSEYYNGGFKKGYTFTLADFDRKSNTKRSDGTSLTFNEIFDSVSKITKVPVNTLKVMAVVESYVGKNKINKGAKTEPNNDGMNTFGYVGLNQFGDASTRQVKSRVSDAVFTPSNSNLVFFGATTYANRLILVPSNWSTNPSLNNKSNNSMFDDYINTMATAYLAIDNIKTTPSNITNVVDTYLAHQQGRSGLNAIKQHQLSEVNGNAIGNPPNPTDTNKKLKDDIEDYLNKEWYAAWAGRIDSVALKIDPNYKSSLNNNFPNANKLRATLTELAYIEKGNSLTSANEDITPEMEKLASAVLKKVKELYPTLTLRVTAGNDTAHVGSANSRHKKGNAIDFTIIGSNGQPIIVQGSYKTKKNGGTLKNSYTSAEKIIIVNVVNVVRGFTKGGNPNVRYLDEYTIGSAHATAPHIHLSYGGGTEGDAERIAAINDTNLTSYTV